MAPESRRATSTGSVFRVSRRGSIAGSASPSISACACDGSTPFRSGARARLPRSAEPRGRCRRATPASWPAWRVIPTTSIPSATRCENFSRFNQDAVYPYGAGGANASFALIARNYMRTFGARREDFGKIAVAQRSNALRNPHALMKAPLTIEQYMSARPIADPIHLFDCVMPCAGAEAFLVMGEETRRFAETARRQNSLHDRAPQCVRRRSRSGAGRMGDGCRRALRDGRRQA